jgi:hypothetical protein
VLSEPNVLASTKEFLVSDSTSTDSDTIRYATVDTQFRKEKWPNVGPIDETTRKVLAPFNHVAIGSGYPDMVVTGALSDVFDPLKLPQDTVPVIAVEAKGETRNRRGRKVPVSKAILQAHDRLSESNAAIAAVPESALLPEGRQLARELDIGLLAVSESDVYVAEPPVPKGVSTGSTASAVRWQAGAQRVADQSFYYNHPKTYLGLPLAAAADADTTEIFESTIAKAGFSSGTAGARFLGLIQTTPNGNIELTSLGKEVVRYAIREHGSVGAALEEMTTWGGKGKSRDLIQRHDGWGEITRNVLFQYPATPFIVDTIENRTGANGQTKSNGLALPELVQALYTKRPAFTVELFIRRDSDARGTVFDDDDTLSRKALQQADVYQGTTVYQYKMMLRHCGILHPNVTASSTDQLSPPEDYWRLRTTLTSK